MELIISDIHSATVKFSRDEFLSINKILSALYQEYESLDSQIVEVPKDYVERLADDFHAMLKTLIDNTNRALQP